MFDFDPEAVDFGKLAQLQLSSYLVWSWGPESYFSLCHSVAFTRLGA